MLKTNPTDRFSFLGIGPADIKRLRQLRPFIEAALPKIFDQFYRDIADHSEVDSMFKDDAARLHAREKQLQHWLTILEGDFGEKYQDSVGRIGQAMHSLD